MEIVQGIFLVTKTYALMVPHAPTNEKTGLEGMASKSEDSEVRREG